MSSTPEQLLWQRVRRVLAPIGHVIRVENALGVGTPDVNYALKNGLEGWIELKVAAPRNSSDQLRLLKPLSSGQTVWLISRAKTGGRCHILIETPGWLSPYLLVPGAQAERFQKRNYPSDLQLLGSLNDLPNALHLT